MTWWIPRHIMRSYAEPMPPHALAAATVVVALDEMMLGAREIGGNNLGPWVDKYRRFSSYAPGGPWCAWFASWCVATACSNLGEEMPITPGFRMRNWRGARALSRACVRAGGTWLTEPEIGALAFWERGPRGGWQQHVGIVSIIEGPSTFKCIEGNVGVAPAPVKEFSHNVGEPKLIGFVRLPLLPNATQPITHRRL
jgi:hypothetical protein